MKILKSDKNFHKNPSKIDQYPHANLQRNSDTTLHGYITSIGHSAVSIITYTNLGQVTPTDQYNASLMYCKATMEVQYLPLTKNSRTCIL